MEREVSFPKISIAPMVDRSDTHFRRICRIMTKKALLYTEMTTAPAIIKGDHNRLLYFNDIERPISLQIAGSDPGEMAEATEIADGFDFHSVNINAGCPSDNVSEYKMGACLMSEPDLVRDMVVEMKKKTSKPITVKQRIGIDGRSIFDDENMLLDRYEDMLNFVDTISEAGVIRFIVHARIAILGGLSPHKNRTIPPIRYDDVYRLKNERPELGVEINGGIKSINDVKKHLENTDSVMIGRASYENPLLLCFIDDIIEGKEPDTDLTRRKIFKEIVRYAEELEGCGHKSIPILKHLPGFMHGKRGSKAWKQAIMPPYEKDKASDIIRDAMSIIDEEVLDERINAKDF